MGEKSPCRVEVAQYLEARVAMPRRPHLRALPLLLSLLGCDEEPEPELAERGTLVGIEAWRETDPGQDPLADHRPGELDCRGGWYPEADRLEVDTGACNYFSVSAPVDVPLAPGDRILLGLWWQTLAAHDPAEAHLAVAVGDEVLWESSIPIPGPADARDLDLVLERPVDRGTPITLHLHNHGANTWNFTEIEYVATN